MPAWGCRANYWHRLKGLGKGSNHVVDRRRYASHAGFGALAGAERPQGLVHLYRGRITADHLPASMRNPYELMSSARPPRAPEDVTGMDQYAHCFARWLVLCMPGDEEMQAKVWRGILLQTQ